MHKAFVSFASRGKASVLPCSNIAGKVSRGRVLWCGVQGLHKPLPRFSLRKDATGLHKPLPRFVSVAKQSRRGKLLFRCASAGKANGRGKPLPTVKQTVNSQ